MRINNQPKSVLKRLQKTKAQSMVELAISLPILILLFTGMVEFGFMLNTYLSLQDATRASARLFSNETPFEFDVNGDVVDKVSFYEDAAQFVVDTLALNAREVSIDQTRDNVFVSVITVDVDNTVTPPVIDTITRHPDGGQFYYLYDDVIPVSVYNDSNIEDFMTSNGSLPVDSGLLIIEIYYSYEGILKLPWTTPFFSDSNPATLYASTIMPLVAAAP
jgi:uncharacterized protein YkuJ